MFKLRVIDKNVDLEQDFEAFSDAEIFARKFVKEADDGATAKSCQIFHGTILAATVRMDGAGEIWTEVESTYASLI